MATVPHYAVKRALIDGAIVADEYPLYPLNMCIPRGAAGDAGWALYYDELGRCADGRVGTGPYDRVLFLLMLGESMVHP